MTKARKRTKKLFIVIGIITFFIGSFLYAIYNPDAIVKNITKYLIIKDNKQISDVIVILGGWKSEERIEYGIELYKQGYGRKLLLSGGGTEKSKMKKFLSAGVMEDDVIFEENSSSTYENALFTKDILMNNNINSMILVTTPDQSRRARFIFKKIYRKTDIMIFSSPASGTHFSPECIMNNKEAKEQLVLEVSKLIYYWIKYLFV